MNTSVMRLLWSAILEVSPDAFTTLSDDVLAKRLISTVENRICLSDDEQAAVACYVHSKKPLILAVIQG